MKISDLINKDIVCSCGRVHRCNIKGLSIREGAIADLPKFIAGYQNILIVADKNTFPVCGNEVRELLGDKYFNSVIFNEDRLLVPNERSIAAIEEKVCKKTDLILGIGSGVINDLCKYVSFFRNIECGIIATAPSMDGFASSGAAMILDGMKVTVTTHAPSVIIGDVNILKNAPLDMIRSGYADIIGKYSALCDWRLSELVNREYLCEFVYNIVKEKTDEIRSLASELAARNGEAIKKLTETLVLIGICLTLLSTTRPDSGSEHHLSHYFEITGLIENKPYFLHGTDVGYSTIVTAKLREDILKADVLSFKKISAFDREKCYKKIYSSHSDEVIALQLKAGRYALDTSKIYSSNWEKIREILSQCPTSADIEKMLTDVGYDLSAFEKMYGRKKIQNGIWFAKDLKDRYSVLWLYYELFFGEDELHNLLYEDA